MRFIEPFTVVFIALGLVSTVDAQPTSVLAAGVAAGLTTGLLISQDGGNLRGLVAIMGAAAGGGLGIGIGATVHALHRHYHPVYRAPSRVVRVSPVISPGQGFGAVVAVGW